MTEKIEMDVAVDRSLSAYIPWEDLLPFIKQYLRNKYGFYLVDKHEIRILDKKGVMVNPETLRIKWRDSKVEKLSKIEGV